MNTIYEVIGEGGYIVVAFETHEEARAWVSRREPRNWGLSDWQIEENYNPSEGDLYMLGVESGGMN